MAVSSYMTSLALSDIRQQMRETKALEALAEAYVSEITNGCDQGSYMPGASVCVYEDVSHVE